MLPRCLGVCVFVKNSSRRFSILRTRSSIISCRLMDTCFFNEDCLLGTLGDGTSCRATLAKCPVTARLQAGNGHTANKTHDPQRVLQRASHVTRDAEYPEYPGPIIGKCAIMITRVDTIHGATGRRTVPLGPEQAARRSSTVTRGRGKRNAPWVVQRSPDTVAAQMSHTQMCPQGSTPCRHRRVREEARRGKS